MAFIVELMFLFGIVFLVGWLLLLILAPRIRLRAVRQLPTLEQYLALHPQCKQGRGRIACHVCNSANIHLAWSTRKASGGGLKTHICRVCGAELWHSE
jgi:hypothetical protein